MKYNNTDITNVLHLIDQYKIGGPGKTIINSAKMIDENKFKIHVGTFTPSEHNNKELQKKIIENATPFLKLDDKRGIRISNLKKIRNYIKTNNIKILHTHGYKTDIHGLLIKYFFSNILLISTHHGWIENNYSQKLVIQILLRLTFLFNGIIAVSKSTLNKIPTITKRIRTTSVIHNALIIADYRRQNLRNVLRKQYQIKPDDVVLGVIGRLSPEKGSLEILKIFNSILEDIENIKLMYVGEGPLKNNIRMNIQSLGLDQFTIMAGYQNPVQPFYEAIDILISPSLTEGLSNVILEGLSYGLPVIATNVGGNNEIITHGDNGILVPANNDKAMKNAILELINFPSKRKKIGQNGYRTIHEYFQFEKRIKKIESFYTYLLSKSFR